MPWLLASSGELHVSVTAGAALELLGALVLEDGRRWGDAATDVQRADARAVLDVDDPVRRHWIGRARGYSKTADLAGIAVAAMLTQLPQGSRVYAVAADRDQGRLITDSIAGYRARTDGLAGALAVGAYKVTATRSGTVLEVLPADVASAWGLRPAFLVVDELAQWASSPAPRQFYEAVVTALPKVAGSRLAIITSAGSPAHWSYELYRHALDDPAWRVSEPPGPAPWMPAEEIERERRERTESTFRRLFMNEWTAAEDALATAENIEACATLSGPQEALLGIRYAVGVDLGLKRDRACALVAHAEWGPAGMEVHVDRKFLWTPRLLRPVDLGEVEKQLYQVHLAYGAPPFRLDPWQGAYLGQRLRERGVQVNEFAFNQTSVGRLAATLYGLVRDHRLALDATDDELLAEMRSVQLIERSPGTYRIDHGPNTHDDQVIALGLAALQLLDSAEIPLRLGSYARDFGHGRRTTHPSVIDDDGVDLEDAKVLDFRRRCYEGDRLPDSPTWLEHLTIVRERQARARLRRR